VASGAPASAPASPIRSPPCSCSTARGALAHPLVYGLDTGPPRRVVVVDATGFYVVYDPAEPVPFGEFNQWLVIDRRFRVLARLQL